jgi:tetratricopeptide (TPR) repeat protein
VQDLTKSQHDLIAKLSINCSTYFFMTGDVHQTIYPSAFRWHDIKQQFYESDNGGPSRKYEEPTVQRNFRSSSQILRVAESTLIKLKRGLLAQFEKQDAVERFRDLPDGSHIGTPGPMSPVRFNVREEDFLRAVRLMPSSADRVILTRTDEQRDWIRILLNEPGSENGALHGRETVLTVDEFKGLERDCVILWRFFHGSRRFWESVRDPDKRFNLTAYDTLTECNRLYVALTRAHRYFFVFDDEHDPAPWDLEDYRATDFDLHDDCSWLPDIQERSTAAEFRACAKEFEERQQFEAAEDNYRNAGDLMDAARCRAKMAELDGDWRDAAREWENIRYWERARECYRQAGDRRKSHACQAEMFEASNNWTDAARSWKDAGQINREAMAWTAAGDNDRAYECWKKVNDVAFTLDRLTFEIGHWQRSIASLEACLDYLFTSSAIAELVTPTGSSNA